ncbi:MAG: sulfite exporter TauE/SafE family protein [Micromonosporaceae bacterium]
MSPGEAIAIFAAGTGAGTINTVVGSGSLITFPTLLAFGYPPVVANVTNNVGIVPGSASGVFGYRRELHGQRRLLLRLGAASVAGSLVGGLLLLGLPEHTFEAVIPVLILAACFLVVVQPWLARWLTARRQREHPHGGPILWAGVFCAGVYGGYFGAAQGVLLIGLLGAFLAESLQRINGAKNVLAGLVNATAAVLFIAFAHVAWGAVLLLAFGSTAGGLIGARIGRALPPPALRATVVLIGVTAAAKMLFF